jgi:diguanylate cyclase (GGDEF)-like protein/PAS domain S-box-containing protein
MHRQADRCIVHSVTDVRAPIALRTRVVPATPEASAEQPAADDPGSVPSFRSPAVWVPEWLLIGVVIVAAGSTAAVFTTSRSGIALGGADSRVTVQRVLSALLAAAAAAGAAGLLRRARGTTRGARIGWLLIGTALAVDAVGGLASAITAGQPGPYGIDAATIAGVVSLPFLLGGLVMLTVLRTRWAGRLRVLVDAVIVAVSLLAVIWTVAPPADAGTRVARGLLALQSIRADGDTAALSLAVFLLFRGGHRSSLSRRASAMACWGVVGLLSSDLTAAAVTHAGHDPRGQLSSIGSSAGFLLLAAAAMSLDVESEPEPSAVSRWHSSFATALLPSYSVLLALLTGAGRIVAHGDAGTVVDACLLVALLLVTLRHYLSGLENLALARHLEARVAERTAEVTAAASRLRSLVARPSDVVLVLDERAVVRWASPAALPVLGLEPETWEGSSFADSLRVREAALVLEELRTAVADPSSSRTLSFAVRGGDGRWRDTETVVTSLIDDPAVQGLVLNVRDVTERRALEAQLEHVAFHDALTRLANRALFQDRLAHALTNAPRRGQPVGVLLFGLDGFKALNDALGHDAGDRLLVAIAHRLASAVRPGDTVARLSGDEFAVLLEEIDDEGDAVELAEALLQLVSTPVDVTGRPLSIGASLGMALADPRGGHPTELPRALELLRNADLALARAKLERRGGICRYEPGMHTTLVARVEEESDLREALPGGQLFLDYQPTYRLDDGRLTGVEALLRWNHPVRGLIAPLDFVPLAEDTGLIVPIGAWVLDEACRQAAAWERLSPTGQSLTVAVNVSAKQLQAGGFAETVSWALQSSGLDPRRLVLEITETVLLGYDEATVATLREIRAAGVQVAVDDFGTGYSSLSYLARFPLDVLKVDRAFVERLVGPTAVAPLVRQVGADTRPAALARSIVDLGRALGLATVAEGIEEPAQLEALRAMGCDFGQGFYFARPVTPAEITAMVRDGGAASAPLAG